MPRQRIDDDDDFEITADGHRVLKDGRTARVSCNDAAAARTVPIVPLRFTDGAHRCADRIAAGFYQRRRQRGRPSRSLRAVLPRSVQRVARA
jgi:hypothetical protein